MTPATKSVEVEVDGRALRLSNLDKVLYPAAGFTKAQVIDYYTRAAPYLLPHLRDRPLTLKRYPNGVDAPYFYEKQCPSHRPGWVRTEAVWSRHNARNIDFCVVDSLATLVWLANLADLEMHTSMAYATDPKAPTMMVFDLDPGAPASIVECCRVGLWLHTLFEQLGMESFAKTSGSKGLQVYVPLNVPGVTYDDTKSFAHRLARLLEETHGDLVVSSMKKDLRGGKVLVDWSQNDEHKTTVCVWSLRAKERPTVSTPVTWDEVQDGHDSGDPECLAFGSEEALRRGERDGDLFAPVLELEQELPQLPA